MFRYLDVSEGQVRTGEVRIEQVRTGQVRIKLDQGNLFRTGQVKLGQVKSIYNGSNQVGKGYVRQITTEIF